MLRGSIAATVLAGIVALGGACAGTKDSAAQDQITRNVGKYSDPPSNIEKATVGVPQFQVQTAGASFGGNQHDLDGLAADQMSSLLHQTKRFNVVERAQLEQLLKEQSLEGIVKPEELAKAGQVAGVDYLLIGKVTNFRVKVDESQKGVGVNTNTGFLKSIGNTLGGGEAGFKKNETKITTECGVDIRLVNPTNGQVAVAHFSEFNRVDTAGGLGIGLGGIKTTGDASVQIERDDAGRILRLAFDDALKKMLPEIDTVLSKKSTGQPQGGQSVTTGTRDPNSSPVQPATNAPAAGGAAAPAIVAPAGAKKFCGSCGAQVAAGVKFCPSCGGKIE
jgi:curli biogenesis system outer membrane secretion channel CsgG